MIGEGFKNSYDFNSRLGSSSFLSVMDSKISTKSEPTSKDDFQSFLFSAKNRDSKAMNRQADNIKSRDNAFIQDLQPVNDKSSNTTSQDSKALSSRTGQLENTNQSINSNSKNERVNTTSTDKRLGEKSLSLGEKSNSDDVEASREAVSKSELEELEKSEELEKIAEAIGLTTNQLVSLFEYAEIELEYNEAGELVNLEKATQDLFAKLGFNDAEKEAMMKLISSMMKQEEVASSIDGEHNTLLKEIESLINSNKATENATLINNNLAEQVTPQQLFEQLKQEARAILEQLSEQNKVITEELSGQGSIEVETDEGYTITPNKEQGKPIVQDIKQQDAEATDIEVEKASAESSEQSLGDTSKEETESYTQAASKLSAKGATNESAIRANASSEFFVQGIQTNSTNTIEADKIAVNTAKEPIVTKEDIMNQIIDKAKVVVSEDRSEMVIELKPEALGKLTLKIVTERGEVMAKFFADNYQVKAVLESNMQLLKDSLQKQGVNIQGLSVSVNSQKQESQGENQNSNKKERLSVNKQARRVQKEILNPGIVSIYDQTPDGSSSVRNEHHQYQGTINLTA